MVHKTQQLDKELFALKIIGIVVFGICSILYPTIYTVGYSISSVVFASIMVSIHIIRNYNYYV